MSASINKQVLESYSDQLSQKLIFTYFNTNEYINGADVRTFCVLPQINVFIVKNLFKNWREETEKLKSPYFDYDHEDVQDSLGNFLNTLSFHIKVDRKHFEPLLKRSIEETIDFIIQPFGYIKRNCLNFDEMIVSGEFILDRMKYIKLNRFLIDSTLKHFEGRQSIPKEDFEKRCSEIYIERADDFFTLEDFAHEFNSFIPAEVSRSFYYSSQEIPLSGSVNKVVADGKTINDQFDQPQKTVAQSAAQGSTPLKDSIGLNDRFAFINKLFNGSHEEFYQALNKIDEIKDANGAINEIQEEYASKHGWDQHEEVKDRLFALIEQKY